MDTSNINKKEIDKQISSLIPKSVALKYKLAPISKDNDNLKVAMVDPNDYMAIEDIHLYTNLDIEPIMVKEDEIQGIIDYCFNLEVDKTDDSSLSIVEQIDEIIRDAVMKNASDIHIEPNKDSIRIRFRIDGDLHWIRNISSSHLSTIVSRIKVMGNMDIAEKRVAQDGRVELMVDNNEIDIRLSTMPTIYGEKVVLRLLNKTNFNFEIKDLGFSEKNMETFIEIARQPFGMVLLSGPTGSGKSTTAYTILKEINTMEKNIITVEDPVEYKIDGLNQIQVNQKAGLTFASGLRSILRQDPDYIFIGEIRDSDTSRLAVRAAITGHLIFSTLHTNDSVSSIHRLLDMEIEPYLLSTALKGVISQRLIKLLCPKCKEKYQMCDSEKNVMGIYSSEHIQIFKAVGCGHCNKGYLGRTAIFEVLKINKEIRSLIDNSANINRIQEAALKSGMVSLFDSARELLLEGKTSLDEVIKIKTQ